MKKLLALASRRMLYANVLCLSVLCMSVPCANVSAQTNSAPAQNSSARPPAATNQTAPQTPTQEPAITGVVGGHNAAYTDRIPPEQIIALDANGDKFQARHIADLSGQPLGAVIILHDSGQHPNWPFTAAALIDDLPLHGWDTLAIELPAPDTELAKSAAIPSSSTPNAAPTNSAAPANTSTPPADAANASTQTATGIESKTQARIDAAIKYFADQNQRNIVLIGFGSGAIRAAENVRGIVANPAATNANPTAASGNPAASGVNPPPKTEPLTALVMIAPQQKLSGIEMDLPKLLPLTEIATLDMTLDSEPQARADAEARRRAVLHQRARIYTRLELTPIANSSDAQHSAMVKRVRSWLQKNAQAVH